MKWNTREWQNECYIEKVVSEDCGSYMHSYHNTASWQVTETLFINFGLESIHLWLALQKPSFAKAGGIQTICLWIFLGNTFVHTGFSKNDFVISDACKKWHLLGRQVSCASPTTKQGRGNVFINHMGCSQCSKIILCASLKFQTANYMENLTGSSDFYF